MAAMTESTIVRRPWSVRAALVRVHRWLGLGIALFLFVAGLTGALISWDHELDAVLNPRLFVADSGVAAASDAPSQAATSRARGGLELAAQLESRDPRLQVIYTPLVAVPGETLQMLVAPRIESATGKLVQLDFNQVAIDPSTGVVQGRREWGAVSLARENLLPFLYKLHYTMHIPDVRGVQLGIWVMGIVGIVWVLDGIVALAISFPSRAAWRKSLAFRWGKGGFPLLFDLHRSSGVWLWLLLLVVALTSVSMNLQYQVVRPIVARFSTLSPDVFSTRRPVSAEKAIEPAISREQVVQLARGEAARRQISAPAGAVFYSPEYATYGVGFFSPGQDHGDGGLGNPWLYFDAASGAPVGAAVPGTGSAGDLYMQAQFPLHSGRIAGTTGRVVVSALGLVVASLSLTGVLIWVRKQRARRLQAD